MRDTNNNYVKYTYYKSDGQIYPLAVIYTGNGATDGVMEVDFVRSPRPDPMASNKTGFAVASYSRISEIDAKVNGALVHKYVFGYTVGDNNSRTLLTSVTETGQDESGGYIVTLPATTYSYQTATNSNNSAWTQQYCDGFSG